MYYTTWIFFLAPSIFADFFNIIGLLLLYLISFLDTFLRPLDTTSDTNRQATFFLLTIFLTGPLRLILSYYENRIFIASSLPILDSVPIAFLGLLLFISGGSLTLVSRYTLGKFATGKIQLQKNHSLITHGIYQKIRHPIYLGALVGALGFGLIFRSYLLTSITLGYFALSAFEALPSLTQPIRTQNFRSPL